MNRIAALALALALTGVFVRTPEVRAQPGTGGTAGAAVHEEYARRFEFARQLHEREQYVEAALVFEDLWARAEMPRALLNAGISRQSIGDHAHAAVYFEHYLGLDISALEQAEARRHRARSASFITPVSLTITPTDALDSARVTLTRRDANRVDGPFAYPIATRRGDALKLELETGEWTVEVVAPGFQPAQAQLSVVRGQPTAVAIELVGVPTPVTVVLSPPEVLERGVDVHIKSGPGLTAAHSERVVGGVYSRTWRQGTWDVSFRAPGYAEQTRTIVVGVEPVEIEVALTPEPAPAPPPGPAPRFVLRPRERTILGATLGGLGAATISAGVGFAIGGELSLAAAVNTDGEVLAEQGIDRSALDAGTQAFRPYADADDAAAADAVERAYSRARYHADLCAGMRFQVAGAGMIGGGVGFAVGALAARLDAPEAVWWTGVGLGAAATVTGAVWLAAILPRWRRYATLPIQHEGNDGLAYASARPGAAILIEHRNAQVALGAVTGFGAGLTIAALGGLIVGRVTARRSGETSARARLTPTLSFSREGGGFALFGAF